MRAEEFLVELRDRMYQYIKSIVPTWPDYVVKDWLYANQAKPYGRQVTITPADRTFATLKTGIPEMLADVGLTVNTKWQLIPNMKFTMDMWEPKTQERLIARAGGKPTELVPSTMAPYMKDAERHATQARLVQQQGGVRKEPVIVAKTPQGYELLEGWHRTIQHFAQYPNGYTGPAYVAVAQGQQDMTEGIDRYRVVLTLHDDSVAPDETARRKIAINVSANNEQSAIKLATQKLIKSTRYDGSRIVDARATQISTSQINELALGGGLPAQPVASGSSDEAQWIIQTQANEYLVKFSFDPEPQEDEYADFDDYKRDYNNSGMNTAFYGRDKNGQWTMDITNVGEKELTQIIATVARLLAEFLKQYKHLKYIGIGGKDPRRDRLYQRLIQQNLQKYFPGQEFDIVPGGINRVVSENFADGKVKGKSRPGRVKRSGASCNGSVTDLRRKAKNASGEKARMYHWCANMKSGKKNESEMDEGWKQNVAAGVLGAGMALSGGTAQAATDVFNKKLTPAEIQQIQTKADLTQRYYNELVRRAKEDGRIIDRRTLNMLKAKAEDAAARNVQQQPQAPQAKSNMPGTQPSEIRRSANYKNFESVKK